MWMIAIRIKRLGLYLALPAILTLLLHAAHPHVTKTNFSDQDCAICQTPTVGAQPATQLLAPTFFVVNYAPEIVSVYLPTLSFSSAFPRAPPAI